MHIKNKIPILLFVIFLLTLVAYIFSLSGTSAAAVIDRVICEPIISSLSLMNSLVPFSVFEFICVASPIILFLAIRYIYRGNGNVHQRFRSVFAFVLMIPTAYFVTLGIPRGTGKDFVLPDLADSEVFSCAAYLVTKVNEDSRFSKSPISSDSLRSEFAEIHPKTLHGWQLRNINLPKVKKTAYPKIASRLGILAYFSFLTAEIHINVDIPEYQKPFTFAHEYAHFLGITSEAEAGYFAFLTCSASTMPPVRYSGNLCALEYMLSDIYNRDAKMYIKLVNSLNSEVKNDISLANEYFLRYSSRACYKTFDRLNSSYLSAQDKHSKKSYSIMSKYVASYLLDA